MPKSITRRDLILKTSVTAGDVSEHTISMKAEFDSNLGTTIIYEDESGGNKDEKTKYKMTFANPRTPPVGAITLKLVGDPKSDVGATITKPVARYDFQPPATQSNVPIIPNPNRSWERVWKQKVRDSAQTVIVNNVAKLDVRVEAGSGYTVSQSATSVDDNELVISYQWMNSAGAAVITGSVTFTSRVTAESGYTLGQIKVTDTPYPPT